jgi:hypothetical protein
VQALVGFGSFIPTYWGSSDEVWLIMDVSMGNLVLDLLIHLANRDIQYIVHHVVSLGIQGLLRLYLLQGAGVLCVAITVC